MYEKIKYIVGFVLALYALSGIFIYMGRFSKMESLARQYQLTYINNKKNTYDQFKQYENVYPTVIIKGTYKNRPIDIKTVVIADYHLKKYGPIMGRIVGIWEIFKNFNFPTYTVIDGNYYEPMSINELKKYIETGEIDKPLLNNEL
jgi:hypothetical protein